jgi:opacity protein-like surface antigen
MGGAARAFGGSTDALYANPANMAVARVYHLAAFAHLAPEGAYQEYGAAAVDSVSSGAGLAGGIGAHYVLQDPSGVDREGLDVRFALALPIGDKVFIGLGGRHLSLKQNGDGPLGPSVVSSGLESKTVVRRVTADAGLTVKPIEELAISLVGNNLTNPGDGFQPLSLGGGVGFGIREFTAEADVVGDFTTWDRTTVRAMGGAEFLVAGHVPLRAGYRFDEGAESHAISAGVGFIDRVFALELGARRVLSGPAETAIFLGFRYHLDAADSNPNAGDSF